MSYIPGQPVTAVVQRVEIHKLRQGENLILGFSIGGGIDQDPSQNPFSEDKTDKGIYVTRVSEGGPAEIAGLQIGDKIMQVTEVPKEENKAWVGGSEALGRRRGCPYLPGHLGNSPKPFWSSRWCCPQKKLAVCCVCIKCGAWGPPAQGCQLGGLLG
uniref:Tax1-binding protein 3 n=1 Tax=Rhinolophus ferrumequinum TaxID=59479 RepID=A0A671FZY5_RHIFE